MCNVSSGSHVFLLLVVSVASYHEVKCFGAGMLLEHYAACDVFFREVKRNLTRFFSQCV